ncbi:DUF2256 domain-containing protein [Agrobacterium vitis]
MVTKKADLPTKLCVACHRPFAWRKKWARCWEEVRFCSERCRNRRAASRELETAQCDSFSVSHRIGRKAVSSVSHTS